jgi:hypothetical protein
MNCVACQSLLKLTADRAAWDRRDPLVPTVHFDGMTEKRSGDAPLLAGEVLYHLRTALVYVTYNLAWLDSGRRQSGTAFPIPDKSNEWANACRTRLKGVGAGHCRVIRGYQPFDRCTWTADLRDFSNQEAQADRGRR